MAFPTRKSTENLAEPEKGGSGFTRELPEAGAALFRLQSYIELGQLQPKNKTWKPSVDCMLTFELLHPKHMITPEGKPPFPQLYTVHVPKSLKEGSRFIKLFTKMNYDGTHNHFDTMVGSVGWLGKLFHKKVGEGKDAKTYVNLNNETGEWIIGAPSVQDPLTEKVTEVPIPEMHNEGKLFLWEQEGWDDEDIKTQWDTLFIETPEDSEKSRNWIQERIQNALDWDTSRTKAIVTGEDIEIAVLPGETAVVDDVPFEADEPVKKEAAPKADASEVDVLASLGI